MGRKRPNKVERVDKLGDMPDLILLHIMNFMKTKQAVQTCVLSTRWKHLWKHLTNLELDYFHFSRALKFKKFLSSILSCRDGSTSLNNVVLRYGNYLDPDILDRFIEYVVSHDIQELTLDTKFIELPPCIFLCQSLTFLKISNPSTEDKKAIIPKSLGFPALKTLHIENVPFETSDTDYVEPFSTCKMLNTLVIENCNENEIWISSSSLTNLTIISASNCALRSQNHKFVLCTPRLSSCSINGYLGHPLSSTCDIFLKEVNLDVIDRFRDYTKEASIITSWLQVFKNVTTIKLSSDTLEMLNVLLFRPTIRTQLPHFIRLKSLKVELDSSTRISSDKEVSRIVEYLLENSPSAILVDIIRHA